MLDLKSGDSEFKFCSDLLLDLFLVVHVSTPGLQLKKPASASWDSKSFELI